MRQTSRRPVPPRTQPLLQAAIGAVIRATVAEAVATRVSHIMAEQRRVESLIAVDRTVQDAKASISEQDRRLAVALAAAKDDAVGC